MTKYVNPPRTKSRNSPVWNYPVFTGRKQNSSSLTQVQRLFIQEPPSHLQNSSVHLAVVMPFLECQFEGRLKPSIQSWQHTQPCTRALSSPVALILHHNKIFDVGAINDVKNFWRSLSWEVKNCFTSMELWSAGLSAEEDVYPMGPCVMFHRTFVRARIFGFSHWLQYEPDVFPIRTGWLERAIFLVEDNPTCDLWWQLGSEPSYDSVTDFLKTSTGTRDVDLHINGNALYCVNSPEFAAYRAMVRELFPPMGCLGDEYIGEFNGHDHALYRARRSDSSTRFQHVHYKFRLDPFIRNFGASAFDMQTVRTMYPETYLIHGKYERLSPTERAHVRLSNRLHLNAEEENELSKLHWQAVGRLPSRSEISVWFKIFLLVEENTNRLKLIHRLHHACEFKSPDATLMQYFGSSLQLAVISSFVNVIHAMPGPAEMAMVAKRSRRFFTIPHLYDFENYCKLSAREACKRRTPPVVPNAHCPDDPPAHFLRLFDDGWQFIGGDDKTLHVRRGAKYTLENPSNCGEVKVVHGRLKCASKFLWTFASSTPHVRRRRPRASHQSNRGLFEDKISSRYPSTNFYTGSTKTSDFNSTSAYDLEARALQSRATVWTTDFHAGPFAGNSAIFSGLNVKIDARIDFGNCMYFKNDDGESVCANVKGLKVLANNDWNGFGLHPCPAHTRENFYYAYADDPDFKKVGAVMCSHPVANCELYMPLGKPMILYFTTRLEFGRDDRHVPWREPWVRGADSAKAWEAWIDNFLRIAANEYNVVLANNEYDSKYVEHFTGIRPEVIPSWSGPSLDDLMRYDSYLPTRLDILLTPYRSNLEYHASDIPVNGWPNMHTKPVVNAPLNHPIFDEIDTVKAHSSVDFNIVTMAEAYPRGYSHIRNLREFPMFLFIPYQASVMSFFELYRLGVPILVPSEKLLLRWMRDHRMLFERIYGEPANVLSRKTTAPSPNSFRVEDAKHWIPFYDIYQKKTFPYLLYFDDWAHAIELTQTADLGSISAKMNAHNRAEYHRISSMWEEVFVRTNLRQGYDTNREDPLDFASALWQHYRTSARGDSHTTCSRTKIHKTIVKRSEEDTVPGFSKCSEHQSKRKLPSEYHSNLFDVVSGEYLKTCDDAHFDERTNKLTCVAKHTRSVVSDPYACASLRYHTYSQQLLCY